MSPIDHDPAPRPTRGEPLWMAAGAAVFGVLLGGAAVFVGLRGAPAPEPVHEDRPEPVPALPPAEAPAPDCPQPSAERGPSLVDAVARTRDTVVTLSSPGSLGAGVLVDETGLVLTNYHVVAGQIRDPNRRVLTSTGDAAALSEPVRARFVDGRELPAELLVADRDRDIALLRLRPADSAERFPFAARGRSRDLKVGEAVFAVGTPLGLDHSVASGIVSAVGRTNLLRSSRQTPLLQLDAAINLGNSGGPLFNLHGQVVGITTATLEQAQGIAFAIPIDHIDALLEALRAGQAARSGQVGAEVSPNIDIGDGARALGYTAGLVVGRVLDGRPAAVAGLRQGDVIVEAQGQRFDAFGTGPEGQGRLALHFVQTVRGLLPGEVLQVTVVRGDARLSLSIPVAAAPPDQQVLIDADALLGLRIDEDRREPTVKALREDAPIARSRGRELLIGARLSELAGIPVQSRDDLGPILSELRQIGRYANVQAAFVLTDGRTLRVRDFPVTPG